jgi:hypothetical protein
MSLWRIAIVAALLVSCAAPVSAPSPSAPLATPSPSDRATTVPTPSSIATAVSSPTAVPSPTTTDPNRYGVLLQAPGRIFVRRERSLSDVILAIGGEQPAASHDGRHIAFWRTGTQRNNPQELRIVDVVGGAERMLTGLPAAAAGGPIVWANDDSGLLWEVHSTEYFAGIGGGPKFSRLESKELSDSAFPPGATHSELMLNSGRWFVPLAWDKPGAIASALITGEGGMTVGYVTWDRKVGGGQGAVKNVPMQWSAIAFTMRASHDAKLMLAIDLGANGLRVWPIGDISAAALIKPAAGMLTDARWRSGTSSDIAWVAGTNVEVFTYGTSAVGTVYRGQGMPFIEGWRADGSAIYLFEIGRGTFVVELANLSQTVIWPDDLAVVGATILR